MTCAGKTRCCLFFLTAAWATGPVAFAEQKVVEIGRPAAQTAVPRWDLRGSDLLPWQGIACIDMSADGTRVAVGTIAPPGDPNVFVLDRDGAVVQGPDPGGGDGRVGGERDGVAGEVGGEQAGAEGKRRQDDGEHRGRVR